MCSNIDVYNAKTDADSKLLKYTELIMYLSIHLSEMLTYCGHTYLHMHH